MKLKAINTILLLAGAYSSLTASTPLVSRTVCGLSDTSKMSFVSNSILFKERWDTLQQVKFWQQVINLNADTALINIAANRQILHKIPFADWSCQSEAEKSDYKKFINLANGIDTNTSLYVTFGKKEFYEYKRVIPTINTAIRVFNANSVDPWYAQTILLIENPGKNHNKSYVGANGPFQLMKSVALKYGLKVNSKIDERTDLNKAAMAASQLLKYACIPKIKALLESNNIAYNEEDLWFRLLVLHAYHAGPGNVACVINELKPKKGGIDLFTKIWQTECGGFKNESQNYSQIALANIVIFENFLNADKDTMWLVQGEKLFSEYKKNKKGNSSDINALKQCMESYSDDLMDGTIPADFFISRMEKIQKEITAMRVKKPEEDTGVSMNKLLAVGNNLIRKRQLDDAIKILKLNITHYPNCVTAYDSLSRIYKQKGDKQMSLLYTQKGAAIKNPVY
ncbi:MAG: transglycosylase SLT domain-containing protein [Bacteroidetes bacterium]|nr:transglycosylase SLT domain-containing protein [Bacteroidota bacterium]